MSSDVKSLAAYAEYDALSFTRRGPVLLVEIAAGDPLNLITSRLHTELCTLFRDVADDNQTKAVVLTGSDRAFCAGADVNWLLDQSEEIRETAFAEARRTIVDLLELPIPIISAIRGPAVGLGATVALFCDITVAADDASIGDPHVLLGLVAGDGGAVIYPWLVGMARAKELLLCGDLISGAEAARIGLVSRSCSSDQVLSVAMGIAERLANGPQLAIQGTKAALNSILRETTNLVLDKSLALERRSAESEDHNEAIRAFLDRRPRRFNGSGPIGSGPA